MSRRIVWYMHLWHGYPAFWDDARQRIYTATRSSAALLVPTLRDIRRQQKASARAWRETTTAYGYVRVQLPVVARPDGEA